MTAELSCLRVKEEAWIGRHLAGALTEEEAGAFEAHRRECTQCRDELERAGAREQGRPARLASWSDRLSRIPVRTRVLVAGAGLIIFVVLPWLVLRTRAPELVERVDVRPEVRGRVLDELAEVEPPAFYVSQARGEVSPFRLGMQKYAEGEYAAAVPLLEETGPEDPAYPAASFYLGICHLMVGDPDRAILQLSPIASRPSHPYAGESHWYLAKAHLRKHDIVSAQGALETAITSGSLHSLEARDIMKKLAVIR